MNRINVFSQFLLLSLLMPIQALASPKLSGPSTGGGGQGVLCNVNGNRTLETLDLYEAKHIWGYDIPAGGTLEKEADRIIVNILLQDDHKLPAVKPTHPGSKAVADFLAEYAEFVRRMRAIPNGARLELSHDDGGRIIRPPQSCEVVQIMYYADENDSTGAILVDQDYWKLLDPQNQLALLLHESYYKMLRFSGETTSTRTRKLVGLIFGSKEFPGRLAPLYGKTESIYCYAETPRETDAFIAFWVIPTNPADINSPAILSFDSLSIDSPEPILVETTAYTNWSYSTWKTNNAKESGYVIRTTSVLGSETINFRPENNDCLGEGKQCPVVFKVKTKNGKWVGGPVVCRAARDSN